MPFVEKTNKIRQKIRACENAAYYLPVFRFLVSFNSLRRYSISILTDTLLTFPPPRVFNSLFFENKCLNKLQNFNKKNIGITILDLLVTCHKSREKNISNELYIKPFYINLNYFYPTKNALSHFCLKINE